jgi:hypothetical protein
MRLRFLPIIVAVLLPMSTIPLLAGDGSRPFSPSEKRAYHACLYASFIENYCRFHAWGATEAAFRECIISQGAGRLPLDVPRWGLGINDVCRALSQARPL